MFYVRALYKFHASQPGEISLHTRDILLVDHVLDDNWYFGRNLKNACGYFPVEYVEKISLPTIKVEEKLFAAIRDFDAPEHGDLKFCKSDIIKGLARVDRNWWKGVVLEGENHELGIFPLTHVIDISSNFFKERSVQGPNADLLKGDPADLSNTFSLEISLDVNSPCITKVEKGHKRNGSWYNQANTKSLDSSVRPYARTLYPYEAVGPDEISFMDNEILHLLEHYSGGWSRGIVDGKEGLFPTSYVDVIVDCSPSIKEIDSSNDAKCNGNDRLFNTSPKSCEYISEEKELYGRVLYSFSASTSDQIDLEEGDTITILRKINKDWYQAQHDDGRIGQCPSSYVEVFGAEPDLPSSLASQNCDDTVGSTSCDKIIDNATFAGMDFKVFSNSEKPSLKPKPSFFTNENLLPKKSNLFLDDIQSNEHPSITKLLWKGERSRFQDTQNVAKSKDCQLLDDKIQVKKIITGEHRKVDDDKQLNLLSTFHPLLRPGKPPLMHHMLIGSDFNSKFVPSRTAPSRPSSLTSDLIQFSPEHEVASTKIAKSTIVLPPPSKHCNKGFSYLNPGHYRKPPLTKKPPSASATKSPLPLTPPESGKMEKKDKVLEELIKTESDYLKSLELCRQTFKEGSKAGHCPSNVDLDNLFGNIDDVIRLSCTLLESFKECTHTAFMQIGNIGQCFLRMESDFKIVYAPYCRNHDNVLALLEKYEGNKDIQAFFRKMIDSMKENIIVFDLASILIKPVQRILKYPLLLSELDKCTDSTLPGKEDITLAMQCMANIASYINEFKRKQDLVSKYKQDGDEKLSDKLQRLSIHSTKKKLARIGQMLIGIQTVDEEFKREEQTFRSVENLVRILLRDFGNFITCSQESEFAVMDFVEEVFNYYADDSAEMEIGLMREVFEKVIKSICVDFKVKVETEIVPHLNSLLTMFRGPLKVIKKRRDKLLDFENSIRQNVALGDNSLREEPNDTVRSTYEALNSQLLDELPRLNRLSLEILTLLLNRFLELKNLHHQEVASQMKILLNLKLMTSVNQDSKLNVAQQFNIGHSAAVDLLSRFSFIPLTFNPAAYEIKKSRRVTMDDSLLSKIDFNPAQDHDVAKKLLQKYPPEKLFRVKRYFAGFQAMDARLAEGTVVAVLKENDPMGNRERWYIDDASSKGFILTSYLEPYVISSNMSLCSAISSSLQISELSDNLEPCDSSLQSNKTTLNSPVAALQSQLPALFAQSAHRSTSNLQLLSRPPTLAFRQTSPRPSCYSKPESFATLPRMNLSFPSSCEDDASKSSTSHVLGNLTKNQKKVKVLFDFVARSSLELSIAKDEILTLIETNDLTGNREWWYLRNEDLERTGYVPASYVRVID